MGDSYASAVELLSPSIVAEKYVLDGSEDVIRFTNGRNVVLSLVPEGSAPRDRDSARVHTKVLSDFKGETRAHCGRSLTVQRDLLAFRLHLEATGDVIRIMNRVTGSRHLIKNYLSPPVDIAFAPHAPLLAVLDANSSLYVYNVPEDCSNVSKYINIGNWPDLDPTGERPRVVWCPYSPENPSDPTDICHTVAVFQGKKVHIINLSMLAEHFGNEHVDFEAARMVKEAVLTVQMKENITVVCISPDSTAVAIGSESGLVSFYIVNGEEMTFAHNWNPRLETSISHLFFLDDISSLLTQKTEAERFWRHCVVAGEGGRRLALYECEGWRCLGTLRFDSTLDISQFSMTMDPKMRYVHLLDPDGANIFCVELDQDSRAPRFLSITQVAFCRPVSVIYPYDVTDAANESNDDLWDESQEDFELEKRVSIHYVAMNPKSLMQLDVQVAKTEVYSSLPDYADGNAEEKVVGTGQPADKTEKPDIPSVELHLPSTSQLPNVELGGSSRSWHSVDKEEMDQRFNDIYTKLEQISMKVDKADSERSQSRTNEDIIQLLQQFKEEFNLREDRLLANISDLIETSRAETLSAVRNALNENSVAVENSIQLNHKQSSDAISSRVSEKMRDSLATVVVPAVDRICSQLFRQLNETFSLGMEQYLSQMRALHNATLAAAVAATPAPSGSVCADRQQLQQMIRNKETPLAFETVLNQGDMKALEFVCSNVDPDDFFSSNALSQPVLISLLQQLSLRLESETDLKLRYMENIFEHLRVDHPEISKVVPGVLAELTTALTDLQLLPIAPSLKRVARVLQQVIKGMPVTTKTPN